MLRVVRFTRCTPSRLSSSETRRLSLDVAMPRALEAAEYPPCSITLANMYMSLRSCISSIFDPRSSGLRLRSVAANGRLPDWRIVPRHATACRGRPFGRENVGSHMVDASTHSRNADQYGAVVA